jgi:hypothetical protein
MAGADARAGWTNPQKAGDMPSVDRQRFTEIPRTRGSATGFRRRHIERAFARRKASLQTQREEAELIWKMQSDGHAVEHRSDADVCAMLGVEIEVDATPQASFGPAPDPYQHTIAIIR